MYNLLQISEANFYCRYFDIHLNSTNSQKPCGGKFGSYLSKMFGVNSLPYGLKLIDLVLLGCFSADLFVKLPKEYFLKWKNYPIVSAQFDDDMDEKDKYARFYNLHITVGDETKLNDFANPYDTSLRESFVNKYSIDIPAKLEITQHPNGRSFLPYEAYFSYWRAYVIVEMLEKCKFIDLYVNETEGINRIIIETKLLNEKWNDKYRETFDRLSHYITFSTMFIFSNARVNCTDRNISEYLLKVSKSSISDLKSDLASLLELHYMWQSKFENNGFKAIKLALIHLKRDIYFLYEWLCSAGYEKNVLFRDYSYQGRRSAPWSQLKDVLDFEEIRFSESFKKYVPIYLKSEPACINCRKLTQIYDRLSAYDSFEVWVRSFYDLHESINRKDIIHFVQPRTLDNLLVLTIRTEILIRTMFSTIMEEKDPDLLKNLIRKLAKAVDDPDGKVVLETISSSDNWKLTELRDKPEDIFGNIEACSVGKKWTQCQKYYFNNFLKFVASRNYFAHHHYIDDEISIHVNKICGNILVSCLNSILFIDDLIQKGITCKSE